MNSTNEVFNLERAVLIAVKTRWDDIDVDTSLDELEDLANTAGVETVARVIQAKESPDKFTYLGIGRIEELRDFVLTNDIDVVIADDELSPLQMEKIGEVLEIKIMDRTGLILDIFAQRAKSKEGQLQVELAQLRYLLPRLKGSREGLSRLGGGIGTRGPGETKLEVDRRIVRTRIASLRRELEDVVSHREQQRKQRKENQVPQVSLVGYTNAGKSSLLTKLTGSQTYAADQLFATLDPLVRRWLLPNNQEILIADTVGFIRKLPHDLIAAFRATLEELKDATLLLHVVDSKGIDFDAQISSVNETLNAIGCKVPSLMVFSKADLLSEGEKNFIKTMYPDAILVSALTGQGLDELGEAVIKKAHLEKVELNLQFPYSSIDWLNRLYEDGEVKTVTYDEEGLKVTAEVSMILAEILLPYIVEEELS